VIIGASGVGKSHFLEALQDRKGNNWKIVKIKDTEQHDTLSLIQTIMNSFGAKTDNHTDLLVSLENQLFEIKQLGSRPLLLIDDAQHLSADSIHFLLQLSQREQDDEPFIHIVLFSTSIITEHLQHPDFKEFRDIIHIAILDNFDKEGVSGYLRHKMVVSGFDRESPFTPRIVDSIFNDSSGIPERINFFAEKFLTSSGKGENYIIADPGLSENSHINDQTESLTETDDQQITHFVGVSEDISELKKAHDTMRHMAFYDALTELTNRRLFFERLKQTIERNVRNKSTAAILFLDLDKFKEVNDTLGHESGDILLKTVSERLKKMLRDSDTVARQGGDEFTMILDNLSGDSAQINSDIEKLVRRMIVVVSDPILLLDKNISISMSIGITLSPADGSSVNQLLKNADLAICHYCAIVIQSFIISITIDHKIMAQYNLIFQGEIVDGASLEEVKIKVARLFNANEEKTNRLFSGKPIIIKKNLDNESTQKYISVLKKAGAVIHAREQIDAQKIQAVQTEHVTSQNIPSEDIQTENHQSEPTTIQAETPVSSAGLSAGLSALVNYNNFSQASETSAESQTNSTENSAINNNNTQQPSDTKEGNHLSLAEAQSGSLAEFSSKVSPVELPDISALSMSEAETGSLAEFAPEMTAVELPDISELSMSDAESGSLSEFAPELIQAKIPDISSLSMSEARQGTLEGIEKIPDPVKIPDISHLDISD